MMLRRKLFQERLQKSERIQQHSQRQVRQLVGIQPQVQP